MLQLSGEVRRQWEGMKEFLLRRAKIEAKYGSELMKLAEEGLIVNPAGSSHAVTPAAATGASQGNR